MDAISLPVVLLDAAVFWVAVAVQDKNNNAVLACSLFVSEADTKRT